MYLVKFMLSNITFTKSIVKFLQAEKLELIWHVWSNAVYQKCNYIIHQLFNAPIHNYFPINNVFDPHVTTVHAPNNHLKLISPI